VLLVYAVTIVKISSATANEAPGKNTRLLLILVACAVAMVGVAYASVPLYRLFLRCYRLQWHDPARNRRARSHRERYVTVTFDGNVDSALRGISAPMSKAFASNWARSPTSLYHAITGGRKPSSAPRL